MKRRFFICILLIALCISCVQKYPVKKCIQRIPKEVPQMVFISGMDYTGGHSCEGSSTIVDSMDVYVGSFYMSKHEITNKDFCYFLNADSIQANKVLVKEIVAIGQGENKIIFKDGKYHAVDGFENCPVVMVSWWGAKKYCEWLTATIKKKNAKRDMYIASYRLPYEIEWVFATSLNKKQYGFRIGECNEALDSLESATFKINDIKKDSVIGSGVAGMNENVYEWIEDNFYPKKIVNDYSMDSSMNDTYEIVVTPQALVRKYAYASSNNKHTSCGRTGRLRSGFYSDIGFRIVQSYLGKSSGMEF